MGTRNKKLRRNLNRGIKKVDNVTPMQPPPKMNVDISQIPDRICPGCKSEFWRQAFKLKTVSPLLSPTGKELLFHAPGWICAICGLEFNKKPLVDE